LQQLSKQKVLLEWQINEMLLPEDKLIDNRDNLQEQA
jgi:hypothetical protein